MFAPKIPGLQSCGVCVACGERAEAFCAGCRVTPYCSATCQRSDWAERHRKVCHNLKRQSGGAVMPRPDPESEQVIPAPAPLRRPRSPGSDRAPPKKFGPPGNAMASTSGAQGGSRNPRGSNKPNQGYNNDRQGDRSQSNIQSRLNRSTDDEGDRPNVRQNERNNRDRNQNERNDQFKRKNETQDRAKNDFDRNERNGEKPGASGYVNKKRENEDWGPRPEVKRQESASAVKPKSPVVQKEEPKFEAKAAPTPVAAAASASRPLASAADVVPTPARKLVPKNCVIDLLSVKDTFSLTADATGESCGTTGWICLTIPVDHLASYQRLLDPFSQACENSEPCDPRPGETFAYLNPEDGGWYRARRLAAARAALVDAARVAGPLSLLGGSCRRLPGEYADIPEFCSHVDSDQLQLNAAVECTVLSKSGGTLTVSLVNSETQASLGTATVRRWLPEVERPKEPVAATAPADTPAAASASASAARCGPSASGEPPQVPRPPVAHSSRVLLVDATEPERVFVRAAARDTQAEFDDLVCEVALYGADEATPRLTELPTAGQTVVARFTDGMHYRAFVQRVSSKNRRCLLEYIEYGNSAIEDNIANLCPCPPQFELRARPALTSLVTLQMKQRVFSDAATAYLDKLKDDSEELALTIPSGEQSGPSKTPVRLTVVRSGEDVNRTVDSLSTPEWQKILERGGDVLETQSLTYYDIEYVDPPADGCELEVLDCSMLSGALVSGHERRAPHAQRAFSLAHRMEEYCNSALAREPYLPKAEELCIAICPIKNQWLRAVFLSQKGGPGGLEAELLFYDYGHVTAAPVSALRKMMPEFARAAPAAVCSLEIKDFPQNPTPEQLERAQRHMQINDRGIGTLKITRCTRRELGDYVAEAPDLIRAVTQ